MKKIGFAVIMICVLTVFAFADRFTAQNVTGRVELDSGNQRVEVKAGDILDGEAVIHTGIGASVVLLDAAGKTYTVPAARNGRVTELVKAAAGIRIGGSVVQTDTSAVSRTTVRVGTASARASDQAGEEDIASE